MLLDLSKAFDCIPHDLLIAKRDAYGFDKEALSLIHFKNRKSSAHINIIFSTFEELLSNVPQGSVSGVLPLNIFLNDLYLFITKASLHIYTDDSTLSAYSLQNHKPPYFGLRKSYDSKPKKNSYNVSIKKKKQHISEDLTICINDVDIKLKNSIKLFGIILDSKLNCENHIS